MLERNPIAWLEGRDRLQTKLLWGIIMLAAAVLFITHTVDPEEYPSKDVVDAWPFIAHYVLCLWIAIRAPRRLADDKQSGALELLLCTPLTAREIVRGNMLFLRRRFGGVLVTLMALDALLIFTYFEARDGWIGFREDEWSSLSAGALLVFPLQAWSIARVGVYQGLLRANSLRATFIAIWLLGLLPIVLWVVFMVTCDLLNLARNMNDTLISWALATLHVIPCTLFLSYASWRLHFRFRFLAAQAAPGVWWKRWLEEYRRPKGLSIQKGAIRN
jgi:hypothetical protein